MLKHSAAYRHAITGDTRRIQIKAAVDLTDPDIIYQPVTGSEQAYWSKADQIHDQIFNRSTYATLEPGRWQLDGSFDILPDDLKAVPGEIGYVGAALSQDDGTFAEPTYVTLSYSGVDVLQSCTICWPTDPWDGVAADFTVTVLSGGAVLYTHMVRDNRASKVPIPDFRVSNSDTLTVTVERWSLPHRRMRLVELVPGLLEVWGNRDLSAFACAQTADFSSLTLPYGTCDITLDNQDRRFDPLNPDSFYHIIEDRQGVRISVGVVLDTGATEYKDVGTYYQYAGGWQQIERSMLMQWHLVDIVGLLAHRRYILPSTRPSTLMGWVESLVAQLGDAFRSRCRVDPTCASRPLTLRDRADLDDTTCGDVLRWACQATGTFARAASDGLLAVEPHWSQGVTYTLDNLMDYPSRTANDDLTAIVFTIFDGTDTKLAISGQSSSAGKTVSIKNPFIHTESDARTAARQILMQYGGTKLELVGRGDPASEVGDVATVELDSSHATTGRVLSQSFEIKHGVLRDCKSQLLQAAGIMLYSQRAILTDDGTWTVPPGVSSIKLILVGRGGVGQYGTDGTWDHDGQDGTPGEGGQIWYATLNVAPGTVYTVRIGTDTTFGSWSSASGTVFPTGFTDIDSGTTYGRPGVPEPRRGSGDGGAGGQGGKRGIKRHRKDGDIIDAYPTPGTMGIPGAPGCAVIYWDAPDKERETWPLTLAL